MSLEKKHYFMQVKTALRFKIILHFYSYNKALDSVCYIVNRLIKSSLSPESVASAAACCPVFGRTNLLIPPQLPEEMKQGSCIIFCKETKHDDQSV